MVAEPEGDTINKTTSTSSNSVSMTPAASSTPSIVESEGSGAEGEGSSTLVSSSSTVTATPLPSVTSKSDNLVGKMNNLISSDLKAIQGALEFMQPLLLGPLLTAGCAIYLYRLLGLSAFVGFAGMIVQLPIPIWMAKLLQSTTVTVTKKACSWVASCSIWHADHDFLVKSDARIDSVTESKFPLFAGYWT